MCHLCITTAALIAGGTASTGALTALVVTKLRAGIGVGNAGPKPSPAEIYIVGPPASYVPPRGDHP